MSSYRESLTNCAIETMRVPMCRLRTSRSALSPVTRKSALPASARASRKSSSASEERRTTGRFSICNVSLRNRLTSLPASCGLIRNAMDGLRKVLFNSASCFDELSRTNRPSSHRCSRMSAFPPGERIAETRTFVSRITLIYVTTASLRTPVFLRSSCNLRPALTSFTALSMSNCRSFASTPALRRLMSSTISRKRRISTACSTNFDNSPFFMRRPPRSARTLWSVALDTLTVSRTFAEGEDMSLYTLRRILNSEIGK